MLTLLAWHIIYHLVLAWQMDVALRPVAGSWEYLVVGLAFVVPMYVVLFLYGYRSKAVWAGQTEPRLPTLPGANNNAMRWFLLVQWALLIPFLLVLFQLDLSLIQTAIYALVGGLLVLGPLEILILALIAKLLPQDFAHRCRACDFTTLPRIIRWPRSWYEVLWGGWTCPRCESELDRHGNLRT